MQELPELDSNTALPDIVKTLKSSGFTKAHVGIFDLMGTFRERRLALDDIADVMDGQGTFVNVLPQWDAAEQLFGTGPFIGETVSVDPRSLRPYPFEKNACLMVADYSGPSALISPRQLLQQQIEKADALGFAVQTAIESEFIVLQENAMTLRESGFAHMSTYAQDNRCWSGESAAIHADFVSELESVLRSGGLDLLALGLELGPGCFESTLRHTTPMRAAEDHLFLKMFVKAFCRKRGLTASFMSQLGSEFPGLSQHPHLSLIDKHTGENAFVGSAATNQARTDMSQLLKHFIAGMLIMIPQAMALTHHTPNAYRRIAPGNWAPKSASWARQNYSAAIRVITEPASHCRLEYRLPGADSNPYLNLSFILGAGLWGIETKAELPDEFTGGGPEDVPGKHSDIPHDLYVAAENLQRSETARVIWGSGFVDHFVKVVKAEEAAIRRETSAAERARYLETV